MMLLVIVFLVLTLFLVLLVPVILFQGGRCLSLVISRKMFPWFLKA